MKNLKAVILIASSLSLSFLSTAQQKFLPLNRQYNLNIEKHLQATSNTAHTGFRPFLESRINYDSLEVIEDSLQGYNRDNSRLLRKLRHESLISISKPDFNLYIDPLINFEYNKDFADTSLRADTTHFYTNTRGLWVRGDIGKKVSFESTFTENQSFFVNYIDDFVRAHDVVPGQGRVKPFKRTGYDYAMASGYISYTPFSKKLLLNFQFGHGKNFIGEGYRSLFLSDNAFNYPFLKITTGYGKFQYTSLFASLQSLIRVDFSNTPEALFVRKPGIFHYLSWDVHKRVQLGFFEGVDASPKENFHALIPVIFLNTVISAADGDDAIVGLNFKIKPFNKFAVYGQLAITDFYSLRDAMAGQVGYKWFDVLKIKNLHLQSELNYKGPYAGGFTHYSQSLSHPLGNDLLEVIGFINYNYKDFYVQLKVNQAQFVKRDPRLFFGTLPAAVNAQELSLSYLINRKSNLNVTAGITNRDYSDKLQSNSNLITFIALRTSVFNHYYDF